MTTDEIPVDEFPTAIVLPTFDIPPLLVGAFPDEFGGVDRKLKGLWVAHHESSFSRYTQFPRAAMLAEGSWLWFARMFAKMAHSYAVAERGLNSFTPMLTDLIREKTEYFDPLIGTDPGIAQPYPSTARIGLRDVRIGSIGLIIASMQLFCGLQAPNYHVIVGKILDRQQ